MDQERARIQEDLRGVVQGEVRCDDLMLQLYSSDASIYQIKPLAVVRPLHTQDVVACVQYANEHHISVHARGSGSGLAGESLGSGIIIDFAHSMRRILGFNGESIRFQPGVILARLNQYLAKHRRMFGPDPSNPEVTTMGSVLALDNSGSHWLKYRSPRMHIEELEVVLADGSVLRLSNKLNLETLCAIPIKRALSDPIETPTISRLDEIQHRLRGILTTHQQTIREHTPVAPVHRCGYHLSDLLEDEHIDLTKLLVGSEGTLGLITEATVRTSPLPDNCGVLLLFFDRLDKATQASQLLVNMDISACDLLDRRLLVMARETDPRFVRSIPDDAEAMLLVEVEGDSRNDIREHLARISESIQQTHRLAFASRIALEQAEIEQAWSIPQNVIPTLYRLEGSTRAIPFIEDISVPPDKLPDVLPQIHASLQKHETTASLFGHLGHGVLHIRPFLNVDDKGDVRKLHAIANDIYEPVIAAGGTISGEHGSGLSRTWFMRKQFGPLYDVFAEVKRVFDPRHILNPGKVISEMPQPIHNNLRPVSVNLTTPRRFMADVTNDEQEQRSPIELQLAWTPEELAYASRACNGCGRCRDESAATRMCPIFQFAPSEEASPRAKANLLRGVITGRMPVSSLGEEDVKAMADLCVNCHQCRVECPASVDIPKIVQETKAQYVRANGLKLSESLYTKLDRSSRWANRFHRLYNWSIRNRQMRWILEKFTGLAQGRKLPQIASTSFLKWASRNHLNRSNRDPGNKVLYFVDIFANWFDPDLARCLVSIFKHHGISVYVPGDQLWSSSSAIAEGDLEYAREVARRNVTLLAEAVRQGYTIVTTEPTAAMCLTQEYRNLLGDDDTSLVAENTQDACHYLWQLHEQGSLELDLQPVNYHVGYHLPCHLRALAEFTPGEHLLRLIPGLSIKRIDKGCSGMAGTFGLKRKNYRNSLRSGWGLISTMRDSTIQVGTTECSSCKIQMEQGTTKPTLHPIKLLAHAYRLAPHVSKQLAHRSRDLTTS